jgi:hypothetical protein
MHTNTSLHWTFADRSVQLQDYFPDEVLQPPHDISKLSPFMMNRVLSLLEHGREHITPQAVEIHYVQPESQENRVRVPISVLRAPDSTIYKFAVRALLGDLERGESSMHAKFEPNTNQTH